MGKRNRDLTRQLEEEERRRGMRVPTYRELEQEGATLEASPDSIDRGRRQFRSDTGR